MITSYFLFTGLMLLYNTIRDLKTRTIDSRFNYFAMGATIMLMAYNQTSILQSAFALLMILAIWLINRKIQTLANGDIEALTWILLGLWSISYINPIKFFLMFTMFYSIALLIVRIMKVKETMLPCYPMILLSYIITALWLW